MSKNYNQLSTEQRYQIEALIKGGKNQKEIACILQVHPSTISRELRRNTPQGGKGAYLYWATNAQRRTELRHRLKPKVSRFTQAMKETCRTWLEQDKLSPELISARGKIEQGDFVSHETIYKWIWRCKKSNRMEDKSDKKLYLKLRHNPRRQKRGRRHDQRGNIPLRISIDKRPVIVQKRKRIGDLEVDLMLGSRHQSAILVSLDRTTLKVKLRKLPSKESAAVKKILVKAYQNESWIKTITFDNDSAFMKHKQIGEQLKASTYFTRPYSSQDKGSVENRIGIIRRFLPKKSDLRTLTAQHLRSIENKLNNRPIRKFNYKTANQVFLEKIALTS